MRKMNEYKDFTELYEAVSKIVSDAFDIRITLSSIAAPKMADDFSVGRAKGISEMAHEALKELHSALSELRELEKLDKSREGERK